MPIRQVAYSLTAVLLPAFFTIAEAANAASAGQSSFLTHQEKLCFTNFYVVVVVKGPPAHHSASTALYYSRPALAAASEAGEAAPPGIRLSSLHVQVTATRGADSGSLRNQS